jgi:hypothetical protein
VQLFLVEVLISRLILAAFAAAATAFAAAAAPFDASSTLVRQVYRQDIALQAANAFHGRGIAQAYQYDKCSDPHG